MNRKKYYTTGEVSRLINVSLATVARKFDAGIFQGKKNPITGDRLISHESLVSFARQYNLTLGNQDAHNQKNVILCSSDERLHSFVKKIGSINRDISINRATSGYDALLMCMKNPTDLLIFDDRLSGISSIEALKSLKRLDEEKKMKILCCLETDNSERSKNIAADDFIALDTINGVDMAKKIESLLYPEQRTCGAGIQFKHERQQKRIPVNLPAQFEIYRLATPHVGEQGNAKVKDISLDGANLSHIHLKKGNIPSEAFRVLLKIDQPPLRNWQAECEVARFRVHEDISAGVQFINISQTDKDKIAEMIL